MNTNQNRVHPGQYLQTQFLEPLGIAPEALASSIGLPLGTITLLLQGKTPILPDIACRLALFFNVPVRWWLEMQARYDAENHQMLEALRNTVKPYEKLAEVLITPTGVRLLSGESASKAKVELHTIPKGLVERLRAQVALNPPRTERVVEEVLYENGAKALVGEDS